MNHIQHCDGRSSPNELGYPKLLTVRLPQTLDFSGGPLSPFCFPLSLSSLSELCVPQLKLTHTHTLETLLFTRRCAHSTHTPYITGYASGLRCSQPVYQKQSHCFSPSHDSFAAPATRLTTGPELRHEGSSRTTACYRYQIGRAHV